MMDEKTKKRNVFLPAEAGVFVDDNIYFFSSEYNLLYKIHMPDFAVSVVSRIPCEKALAVKWFRKMRYWKEKLILIPSFAEKIWIYDLKSGKWTDIVIDHPQITLKFWGTVVYGDCIFLFGAAYPAILKIDLNDYSVSYMEISCPPEQKKEEEGLFFTDAIRMDNLAYSPVSVSNHVMRLNLDTLEYEWQQIGSAGNVYCGIDHNEDGFWIPSWQHGKIVRWDGDSDFEEFELPDEIASRPYQFTGAVFDGNRILFLSIQDGNSLELQKDTSGGYKTVLTEETKKYIHWEHYENGTIVLMRSDASLDVRWKGTWLKGRCKIDYKAFHSSFCQGPLWDVIEEEGMADETEIFDVRDYVNMLMERQNDAANPSKENTVGISIWKRTG